MSVIHILIEFFKNKISLQNSEDRFPTYLIRRLWSIVYLIVISYTLILNFVAPDLVDVLQPIKLQDFVLQEKIWIVIWLTVFLWPIMEELLFRWGMKWWGWNASLLLGSIVFVIVKYLVADTMHSLIISQFIRSIAWYAIYFLCVIFSFHLFKPRFPQISRMYIKWKRLIFRGLTISFALAHVSNFDLNQPGSWFVLLFIIPQLLLGIMLGFVRIIWWLGRSIKLHMFHNLIQLIPIFLFKYFTWMWKEILTYVPNMKPEQLTTNPIMIIWWFYVVVLLCFVWYNIIWEIRSWKSC